MIAAHFKTTPQRVRQIEARAVARMQTPRLAMSLRDFVDSEGHYRLREVLMEILQQDPGLAQLRSIPVPWEELAGPLHQPDALGTSSGGCHQAWPSIFPVFLIRVR